MLQAIHVTRIDISVITESASVTISFVMATRDVLTAQMKRTANVLLISLNVRIQENVLINGIYVMVLTTARMLAMNRIAVSCNELQGLEDVHTKSFPSVFTTAKMKTI